MNQKLDVVEILAAREVGPFIFAVDVLLGDGTRAELRMTGTALRSLAGAIQPLLTF